MKTLCSCSFNMDTGCVKLRYTDGTLVPIDCTAVENEVAANRFERTELDYLMYNDPVGYVDLVLNGDPAQYLKAATYYGPYENQRT